MPANTPKTILAAWQTLRVFITGHRVISAIIALATLYGGYSLYSAIAAPPSVTHYVTMTAATGTVVASITETGQVSASSNIAVQSQSSGEVLSLPVTAGQHVVAGQALAYIDPTTAQQNVTSAEQALQAAQISLATAENTIAQTRASGYDDVSAAFLGLPTVVHGLDTVLHGYTVPSHMYQMNEVAYSTIGQPYDPSLQEAGLLAESAYQKAYTSYTKAIADFRSTPRTADSATIDALVNESYQAVADLSDALRASTNFLDSVNTGFITHSVNPPSTLAGHISTLTGYTATTNGYLTSLSNDVTGLANDGQGLASSGTTDPLVIQSSKLSVQTKQAALAQAQLALADTVVRAPFNGVVGQLNVQQYQTIGSGVSIATLVSDNQNVVISVNEVDAAKLKIGQKATLTFDALPNVSIAGTVSSVNTIGTVSSGVVSYDATVTFDTPNPNVLPGMSATADIITGTETGLVVPQGAVKTAGGQSYVLTFIPPLADSSSSAGAASPVAPTQTIVTTGLSDNSNTVIERGLSAGTQVVTQTIAGTAATTVSSAAQSTSIFNRARPGGGAIRAFTP